MTTPTTPTNRRKPRPRTPVEQNVPRYGRNPFQPVRARAANVGPVSRHRPESQRIQQRFTRRQRTPLHFPL
jgi:hypothetical protein